MNASAWLVFAKSASLSVIVGWGFAIAPFPSPVENWTQDLKLAKP